MVRSEFGIYQICINTSLNSNVIPERMFEKDDAEKYLQAINHKNLPHAKS